MNRRPLGDRGVCRLQVNDRLACTFSVKARRVAYEPTKIARPMFQAFFGLQLEVPGARLVD